MRVHIYASLQLDRVVRVITRVAIVGVVGVNCIGDIRLLFNIDVGRVSSSIGCFVLECCSREQEADYRRGAR